MWENLNTARSVRMNSPLPIVDGVSPSSQWLPPGSWETILDFLKERFPRVEAAAWVARMARGELVDEKGRRLHAGSRYRIGACIFYYRELKAEERIPFVEQVLYRDEHILVVDKPHFLPVIPAGRFLHETLLVRLKRAGKLDNLVPVHRLDRETAGVILFSLNATTRGQYTALFRNRKVEKVYQVLAPALPNCRLPITRRSRIVRGEPFFCMREVAGEANSETWIEMLDNSGSMSSVAKYRLRPLTGRKHQLRVHLSGLGIPIINDRLYPNFEGLDRDDDFSNPLKLLAKSISFRDPLTGREHYFESGRTLAACE
jgi:tRNA pseudouridine32 synthase/23S rRNA pseudouridine746 synthase